jgi:hypothetical protein
MEILLRDRTTNQPQSVHSGRGGKSIAHDGWEAKSPLTSRLHRTAGYPPPVWRGTVSSAQHPRLGTLDRPAPARALPPVWHNMAPGALDHAGSHRGARSERHLVRPPRGRVGQGAPEVGALVPRRAAPLALGAPLPQPGNARRPLAFETAQDPVVHQAQGGLLLVPVAQRRGGPSPWDGLPQGAPRAGRDRWPPALAGCPAGWRPSHQPQEGLGRLRMAPGPGRRHPATGLRGG